MKVGFHYLEDSDNGPALPAAVFIEPNEWGVTRGHVAAARSGLRLYRPYFKGNPTAAEIAGKIWAWTEPGDRDTILNEINLEHEQFAGGLAAYRRLFAEVKVLVPDRLHYWAGMSPGVPGWESWYDGAGIADGICVHAYGSLAEMKDVVWKVKTRFPNKPIWVKECNFAAGREVDVTAWARNELRPFLDWCAGQGIEAVTYFAFRWPTPDSALRTSLDGAGTEIEAVLRSWSAPVVVQPNKPAPPPPPPPAPPDKEKPVTTTRTISDDGITLTITTPQLAPGQRYWRVREARILNPAEGHGMHNLFVRVYRGGERLVGVNVRHFWPDDSRVAATEAKPLHEFGDVNWGLYGDWIPENGPGPYGVEMAEGPSERVTGMGLPRKQHYSFAIFFEEAVAGGQAPPPPPPGGTPPSAGLVDAIRAAGGTVKVIELNPDGALQKAMRRKDCTPVSDEFPAEWGGQKAVCQHARHLVNGKRWIFWCIRGQWERVFEIPVT